MFEVTVVEMGRHDDDRDDDRDELQWYEILMCCCKCRAECKTCVTKMCIYYIPIIFLIELAGACITVGVTGLAYRDGNETKYRNECPYNELIPCWIIGSSITPFFLLTCIKAMKRDYNGVTFWRLIFLINYIMFTVSTVLGSTWVFDTWAKADDQNCTYILRQFSFDLVLVHWFIFLLATMAMIYVMRNILCCCTENTIKPLKGNIDIE